jgi:SAM-dependent methyltransferase
VCTPADAYQTFMASEIDALCMGHYVLAKRAQPAEVRVAAASGPAAFCLDPWCCPCGRQAALERRGDALRCPVCAREYSILDGVPQLFLLHEGYGTTGDVTQQVERFHDGHVFPTYDGYESLRTLIDVCRKDPFGRMLDANLPYNARVLEVGCGSGHLANFLGIACREIVGVDISQRRVATAEAFRALYELRRVRFARMNLFAPAFRPGQFDFVVCRGVLHHTADPQAALRHLVPLLRPGGTMILSLEHAFGRAGRRLASALTGRDRTPGGTTPDGAARGLGSARRGRRPHATAYRLSEVLGWFDRTGLEFIRTVPDGAGRGAPTRGELLRPSAAGRPKGWRADVARLFGGDDTFVMVGRRPSGAAHHGPSAQEAE